VNKFLRFMAAAPLLASIGTTSSKAPSKLTDGQLYKATAGAANLQLPSVAVPLPRHGVGGANRSDLGLCIGVRRSRLGSRVSYGIPQRRKRRYCRSHLQGRPSGGGGLTALPFINAGIPRHRPRLADPPV
jgi:hypothetical protein